MTEPPTAAVAAPSVIPHPCWLALAARPQSIGLGRRFIRDAIAAHVTEPDHAHTIVLLGSELLTNGLRHAALAAVGRGRWKAYDRPLKLGVQVTGRYVHLLVTDPDPRPLVPAVPPADELAETGRGLAIADALTADLWVTCAHYEKTVHALVAAPGVTLRPAEIEALRGRP